MFDNGYMGARGCHSYQQQALYNMVREQALQETAPLGYVQV